MLTLVRFGACIGNIAGPFFYKTEQAPKYQLGIGSLLVANCLEFLLFFAFRYAFKYENRKKQRARDDGTARVVSAEETAFSNMTDKENPK